MKILVHDINNHLSSISMLLYKLKHNESLDEKAINVLNTITKQTSLIAEICKNAQAIEFKPLEVGDLIKEAVNDSCINLKTMIYKQSSITKQVNKTLIFQMVENILKNSYEANANKVDIYITDKQIEFIDNGHGINKKQLENMVSSNSLSTKGDNRGHGLKSIKKCCLEHKFKLQIKPNEFGLSLIVKF